MQQLPQTTHNLHPVEELFELRANMRALRAREAELRAFFLQDARAQDRSGPFHRIEISHQNRRTLVKSRLPQSILEDRRYYKQSASPILRVVRAAFADPNILDGDWTRVPENLPEDDFDVLEPFDA